MAERAIARGKSRLFGTWWLLTIVLGAIFILGTAREWYHLIYSEGVTISSSLFGTTYYSLVGLHAFHVIVGLTGLSIIMIFTALGYVKQEHAPRIEVFAMYWQLVDAVWVVVLTVVYFIARDDLIRRYGIARPARFRQSRDHRTARTDSVAVRDGAWGVVDSRWPVDQRVDQRSGHVSVLAGDRMVSPGAST